MGKLFGTDGVRGIAGKELTCELAYKIGKAAAFVLTKEMNEKPKFIIGKDTRISGDMFEMAIASGVTAIGGDVMLLGIVPTPAVPFLAHHIGADAGVMISASHNTSEYNGIKIFNGLGYKLSDEIENEIEDIILNNKELPEKTGSEIGRVTDGKYMLPVYIYGIKSLMESHGEKSNRKVLFDLSNGSASATAFDIFSKNIFGYETDFISCKPDGLNINDNCGSTHLEKLSYEVRKGEYDLGIAFDGDADRCLLVDENGREIDGDKIMALFADEMQKEGKLKESTAVVTCMSNLGFHIMCKQKGIDVKVTGVGDRYVLEEMLRGGYNLGGEQSGHIILSDYATTGDGQLTASFVLSYISKYPEKKISEIFSCMQSLPQVTVNVRVPNDKKAKMADDEDVKTKVKKIESKLAGKGRVLLRPSGTEALVRVMIEGEDELKLKEWANDIAKTIEFKI